uniref:Uncharacterized protein n=2 Tax=Aegilops tauschii subsp. strangulata TaxID=200361 RepID=A0A452XN22_AEGTS
IRSGGMRKDSTGRTHATGAYRTTEHERWFYFIQRARARAHAAAGDDTLGGGELVVMVLACLSSSSSCSPLPAGLLGAGSVAAAAGAAARGAALAGGAVAAAGLPGRLEPAGAPLVGGGGHDHGGGAGGGLHVGEHLAPT